MSEKDITWAIFMGSFYRCTKIESLLVNIFDPPVRSQDISDPAFIRYCNSIHKKYLKSEKYILNSEKEYRIKTEETDVTPIIDHMFDYATSQGHDIDRNNYQMRFSKYKLDNDDVVHRNIHQDDGSKDEHSVTVIMYLEKSNLDGGDFLYFIGQNPYHYKITASTDKINMICFKGDLWHSNEEMHRLDSGYNGVRKLMVIHFVEKNEEVNDDEQPLYDLTPELQEELRRIEAGGRSVLG